jgi:hypothetical protein
MIENVFRHSISENQRLRVYFYGYGLRTLWNSFGANGGENKSSG